MRVKRGTLASTKIAGTVYVLLDRPNVELNTRPDGRANDQPDAEPLDPTTDRSAVLEVLREHNATLRDQVEHLRRELAVRNVELRRKDHLLTAALERIPELEAPSGPRDGRRGHGRGSRRGPGGRRRRSGGHTSPLVVEEAVRG